MVEWAQLTVRVYWAGLTRYAGRTAYGCAVQTFRSRNSRGIMPRVQFTPNLQRHVACPMVEVEGETVRAVLDAVFAANPRLRSYVLDDQARLRRHVVVFVDGQLIKDRVTLADSVAGRSEVTVMQALSGG